MVGTDPTGRVDLVEVVGKLPSLGVSHLLLEGGGELNFSMLQVGLIDEIYLTICPLIFGGRDAPTSFDGDRLHSRTRPEARPEGSPPECQRRAFSPLPGCSPMHLRSEPSRLFPNGIEIR